MSKQHVEEYYSNRADYEIGNFLTAHPNYKVVTTTPTCRRESDWLGIINNYDHRVLVVYEDFSSSEEEIRRREL